MDIRWHALHFAGLVLSYQHFAYDQSKITVAEGWHLKSSQLNMIRVLSAHQLLSSFLGFKSPVLSCRVLKVNAESYIPSCTEDDRCSTPITLRYDSARSSLISLFSRCVYLRVERCALATKRTAMETGLLERARSVPK